MDSVIEVALIQSFVFAKQNPEKNLILAAIGVRVDLMRTDRQCLLAKR